MPESTLTTAAQLAIAEQMLAFAPTHLTEWLPYDVTMELAVEAYRRGWLIVYAQQVRSVGGVDAGFERLLLANPAAALREHVVPSCLSLGIREVEPTAPTEGHNVEPPEA